MGAEARCTVAVDGRSAEGKALLETDRLIFRGADLRLDIPFEQMTAVNASDGRLHVGYSGRNATFDIGAQAERWARKILNPPSLLDKLGVKSGSRVSVIDVEDAAFIDLLRKQMTEVREGSPERDSDLIFFGAHRREDLDQLASLRGSLKMNGAIWVIRPKGVKQITESDVMAAGKAAGLVDTKVARFSDTHTAEKLVIPVASR